MFQMNLYIHGPVCSFKIYLCPWTRLFPGFERFSCGATTNKELTTNYRKHSLIKEP